MNKKEASATKSKADIQFKDIYQNVTDHALVPMALRVGYLKFEKYQDKLEQADKSVDTEENQKEQNILNQITTKIGDIVTHISQDSMAANFYASDTNPVVRFISQQPFDIPDNNEILYENSIITNGVHKLSDRQKISIHFSKDIIDEDLDKIITSQLLLQSDILITQMDGFTNTEIDAEIKGLNINPIVPIIIIRGNEACLSTNSGEEIKFSSNFNGFYSKLNFELNEVLLFKSYLDASTSENTKHQPSIKDHTLQRIKDYSNEPHLKYKKKIEPDFVGGKPMLEVVSPSWTLVFKKFVSKIAKKNSSKNSLQADNVNTNEENLQVLKNNKSANKLFAHFSRADVLAVKYADAHRSTYILIYCLGAFALIAAVVAVSFHDCSTVVLIAAFLEFLALIGIFMFFRNDHKKHYHIKWLDYRSLAEILRMTPLLNSLGMSQSMKSFERHCRTEYCDDLTENNVGRLWLMIYIKSLLRWVGFDKVVIDQKSLSIAKHFLEKNLLNGQVSYHKKNATEMKRAGKKLGHFSNILFILAIVIVFIKLLLKILYLSHVEWVTHMNFDIGHYLGILAAFLPILGSAAFAIRNHAEFEISSKRSAAMNSWLSQTKGELINMNAPINFKALEEQVHNTSSNMQSETAGWLEIYEVKETEPG